MAQLRDVGAKPRVYRQAVAVGELALRASTRQAIRAERSRRGTRSPQESSPACSR